MVEAGTMTVAERAFHAAQGTTPDPGDFTMLLDALPTDPHRVVAATAVSIRSAYPWTQFKVDRQR